MLIAARVSARQLLIRVHGAVIAMLLVPTYPFYIDYTMAHIHKSFSNDVCVFFFRFLFLFSSTSSSSVCAGCCWLDFSFIPFFTYCHLESAGLTVCLPYHGFPNVIRFAWLGVEHHISKLKSFKRSFRNPRKKPRQTSFINFNKSVNHNNNHQTFEVLYKIGNMRVAWEAFA